jgi:hypothetical protein
MTVDFKSPCGDHWVRRSWACGQAQWPYKPPIPCRGLVGSTPTFSAPKPCNGLTSGEEVTLSGRRRLSRVCPIPKDRPRGLRSADTEYSRLDRLGEDPLLIVCLVVKALPVYSCDAPLFCVSLTILVTTVTSVTSVTVVTSQSKGILEGGSLRFNGQRRFPTMRVECEEISERITTRMQVESSEVWEIRTSLASRRFVRCSQPFQRTISTSDLWY